MEPSSPLPEPLHILPSELEFPDAAACPADLHSQATSSDTRQTLAVLAAVLFLTRLWDPLALNPVQIVAAFFKKSQK